MSQQPNNKKKFVSSEDPDFSAVVKKHYNGFVHVPARELTPSNFYSDAKAAFERLRDSNFYHVRSLERSCHTIHFDTEPFLVRSMMLLWQAGSTVAGHL